MVITIYTMVLLCVLHVHQDFFALIPVYRLLVVQLVRPICITVKQFALHVLLGIIRQPLEVKTATYVQQVGNALIHRLHQLHVAWALTVTMEQYPVPHVLRDIIRLSLDQSIVVFVDPVSSVFLLDISKRQHFFIAGRYCPNPAEEPILCAPGYAQSSTGQVSCEQCPPGTYAFTAGHAICLPCPPGYHC